MWWFDKYIHCEMITTIGNLHIIASNSYTHPLFLVRTFRIYSQQIWSMQYSNIDRSHHGVYFIPRNYSSYNWKFIPFDQHFSHFPHPRALGNHHSTLLLWIQLLLILHTSEIIQYLSFCVWLMSLSLMSLRFIMLQMVGLPPFFVAE